MHFFIDHTQLTSQASTNDGFGPSSADPTNKYDVSANFQLASEAKAFACQPGHLIVTDYFDVTAGALDPNLVNVILKPMVGLGVTFPTVKYYIYRGIKRDSFFTGGNFNAEGALSSCETVHKMWEDWHASTPQPLDPGDLGFDASLPGTVQIEEIFGNSRAPLRARQVKEGEWIGTFGFSKKICFEVIVESESLNLNLEYARKSKVQIDVSAMTATTPAEVHALRCEKEKILAYVDPAALFGMHFYVGVSGFGLTALYADTLATTFLTQFSTATRVYLDIRSDKGYSYNFYENYGGGGASPNLIKIKPGTAAAFVDDVYLNQGWPLFSQPGWTGPDTPVNLDLNLRIDDNIKPLLFVEDTSHTPSGDNFLDDKNLLNGTAADWSKTFSLRLNGGGPVGAKICVATHVRLQYLKPNTGAAVVNPRLLQFNHRLDTVFGGIDLPIVGSVGAFRELRNEKVGLAEGPDFVHVPDTGMYFDPDVVLLYGSSRVALRVSTKPPYPNTPFVTSALDNVVRSPVFPKNIVFSRWSIVKGGATIRLIDLSVYNTGTKNTSIDGIHFLGLKRDELNRLQATSGFGPVHQRFLVFEGAAEELDDNAFPYHKYEVKVQGLDAAGQRILVAANPPVFVFGAGANMFCSSDFTGFVNLPDVPPDPGRMNQWERVFSGTYDHADADVIAVDADGVVSVDDVGNELTQKKPKVRLKARYFFPINNAGETTPSPRKPSYPLVVIVHGNGHFFDQYDALGQHLAQNGFIVASIDLQVLFISGKLTRQGVTDIYMHVTRNAITIRYDHSTQTVQTSNGTAFVPYPGISGTHFKIKLVGGIPDNITFVKDFPDAGGMAPMGRANVVFRHLEVLKHKFGARVADNIGLIGHSRGAEAVVRVPRIIGASTAPSNLRKINAIISLAPSDYWEEEKLIKDVPYFVLYGSRDGDISGVRHPHRLNQPLTGPPGGSGGFSLYDRTKNLTVKSMSFVYNATHNGFITDNKDFKKGGVLAPAVQSHTALAYMNAFMRQHLLGENIWKPYFTGEFIPGSTAYNDIFQQYKEMFGANFKMIDNFEDGLNDVNKSSSGEAVTYSKSGTSSAVLAEGLVNVLDPHSPHETRGLKITAWAKSDKLMFTVAAAGVDVTANWTHLSFRITQVAGGANSSLDTMQVAIVDANGVSHAMVLSRQVPNPNDRPDDAALTKSAFMTIRMKLADYSTHVDLTKVKSVEFLFPTSGAGNIEIDDVEFTK
jgi:hypothetical protein